VSHVCVCVSIVSRVCVHCVTCVCVSIVSYVCVSPLCPMCVLVFTSLTQALELAHVYRASQNGSKAGAGSSRGGGYGSAGVSMFELLGYFHPVQVCLCLNYWAISIQCRCVYV